MKMVNRKLFYPVLFLALWLSVLVSAQTKDRISELKENIDNVVKSTNCEVAVQVASATKYDLLYEYQSGKKMIPASISKVVTSAIALQYLGAGYEFKTVLYTDDVNISDGVINGNLYIKGYGDPDFSTGDLYALIKKFYSKNITEITGNIIYDDSYLDDENFGLANYFTGDTKLQYWPFVNALSYNKNASRINPSVEIANTIQTEFTGKNIKLDGIIIPGNAPESGKEIARVTHSISEVLANMNKPSDNHSAITLFKDVGAVFNKPPGTLKKGTDAVIDLFSNIGISRSEYEFLEGSGLTRFNFATSNVYIQLLKYLFDSENVFDVFYKSLPVSGVDGTLKKRMKGTEAEQNIHAKTGSINGVSTLTGYAISRDNELLIFYIGMNGFKGGNWEPYRDMQDKICEYICQFSRK
jgi:serine-type D-Ala-D-Ala carboxypeptidase/endopeptidase (penicillin-binding protein 4)